MSNFEEIKPRELKPALLELDGISRPSAEPKSRSISLRIAPVGLPPEPPRCSK